MTLLAGQTALWLALGLAIVVPFAISMAAFIAAFFVVFDGSADNIGEVDRFVRLTDEARRLVPPGLPLLDGDKAAATTAAIVGFQAKKDEARDALWASRNGHASAARGVPFDVARSS
jgi:hypothetical protein